jgi:tRNA(fMet)-specific endonuclease VapC
MTTYLLDTNVCIALINGSSPTIRERFERAQAEEDVMLFSSVVAYELWYGVEKSRKKEQNAQRVQTFSAGPLEWAVFDEDDAREAGAIRAALEAAGIPIGAYDVLLAGQARKRGAVLVTSNTDEFARVSGLVLEDWT